MNPVTTVRETLCRKYNLFCGPRKIADEHEGDSVAARHDHGSVELIPHDTEDLSDRFRHAVDDYSTYD